MDGHTPGSLHTSPEQKLDTCACGTPCLSIQSQEGLCGEELIQHRTRCCPFTSLLNLWLQRRTSFMSSQMPSTGRVSLTPWICLNHHSSVAGFLKSGQCTAPGQSCPRGARMSVMPCTPTHVGCPSQQCTNAYLTNVRISGEVAHEDPCGHAAAIGRVVGRDVDHGVDDGDPSLAS